MEAPTYGTHAINNPEVVNGYALLYSVELKTDPALALCETVIGCTPCSRANPGPVRLVAPVDSNGSSDSSGSDDDGGSGGGVGDGDSGGVVGGGGGSVEARLRP
ncbi:hypothetical protein M0802_003052 [Mischocyttarus mexicanus]|nr:hypothetical protein M0802_003052 [Mischocyttarus mexicanus]